MLDEHETKSHGNNAALLDDLVAEQHSAVRAASPFKEGGSTPPSGGPSAGSSSGPPSRGPSPGPSPRAATAAGDHFEKGYTRASDRSSPLNGAAFKREREADADVETADGTEASPRAALQGSMPRGRAALSSFAGLRELTGRLILFTVTLCANPANDLTCLPSYII